MPPYPHVRSLKIRNFKGISKLDLVLDGPLTLLAGVNGVGKTSVIEALLGAVTEVWSLLAPDGQEAWFWPSGDLVRFGAREGKITLELVFENNVRITCNVPVAAKKLQGCDFSKSAVLLELREAVSPIPLVVYYDQDRIGGLRSQEDWPFSQTNRKAALDTTPRTLSDFKNWFFEKEGDEAREAVKRNELDYRDPEVQAVREVLKSIVGDSAVLRSRKPDGSMDRMLFLTKESKFDIPFEALSGGEKAFFLLGIDLARRLLLEFPGSTLAEAPGFVCIDEIELHLHPAWQKKILKSLTEVFSSCQFIVSTHSAPVIGGVEARHVRVLTQDQEGNVTVTQPTASKGRDSNYILSGILGTAERENDVKALFDDFDGSIDKREFDKAEGILRKLDQKVEGSSSRIAVRRAKLRRLRRFSK